jgi:predicted nucleic acid-binding protein
VKRYVLDASVAAKWFLPAPQEPFADQALELLREYVQDDLTLLIPDLFWPELGNVLWKAVRIRRISRTSTEQALAELTEIMPPVFSTALLIRDAFAIATAFSQTVYDSIYVALASTSGAPLVTADERLLSALGAWFPMQWLGSL